MSQFPKLSVVGSIPIARSKKPLTPAQQFEAKLLDFAQAR
jgi:hypothetical protein